MALYLKACYENREELVPRVSRQKFGMLIERLTSVDLCRPLLVQDNPRPTIARFLFQRPYLSAHLCDVLCNKACTDMQAAVESMEQYNVLSSLSVLPKLRLLQQLLPSLTCPISTGNAHSWNSLMALTQPSNRPCQANGRMQNLVQLALHMEYLGHAGAAWLMSCFFVPLVRIACFIEAAPLASLYAEIRNPSAFLNSSILHTAMSYASSSQATSSSNDSGFDTSDGGAAKRVSTGHPHPSQKQDAAQVGNEQRQQPQGSSPGFDTSEVAAKKVSTGQRHPGQEQEAERQLQQQQRQGPEQQQQQQQQQQGEKQQPGEKQQQHKTELQGVQQKHRDEMQQKLQKLQQVGQLQGPAKQQKAEQLPQPPPPPQHQQQQQQVGQTEQQQQQEGQAEQQQQQQRQAGEEGQCPLMQALQLMQQDGLTQQFEHFCCRQELTALKLLSTLASQANFQRQFDLQKNVCSLHQQLQYMELFEHCLTTQSVAQKSSKMASASAGTVIKEFLLSCAHYQQQLHEGLTVCKSDSFRRQRVIAQLQKLQATRWKELVQLYQDRAGSEQQSVQPTSQQQQQQQQQQVQQPRTHHQQQQQQQHVCPSLATGTAMQRTLFAPCPLTQGMGKQLTLLLQQPGAFQAIGVAATFCPRELAAVDSYFIHKGFGSLCDGLPEEQAKRVRESKAELQEEVGRRLGSAYKQAQQQQDQGEWADREHTPAADSVWVGHQGVEECEHWGQPPECTAPAASCEEDSRSTAAAAAAGWEIGFSAALAGLDEEDFLQRLQQHLDGGVSGSDAVAGSNFSAGPEQNEGGVSHGRGQDQERDRHGLQGLQQQLLQQGRIWDQQGQQIQQQAQQQQQQQQQQGHERLQMVGQRCTEVKEAQAMKEAAEKLQSLEKRRKQALRLLNRPPKEAQRQLGPESDLDIEREGDIERELRQDVDKLKREVEQLKKEGTKQKGQQIQQQQQQQQLQQQQQQQQGHEQLRIEEQRCKGVMRDQAIQETAEGVECIERKLQQALPPWASEQAQRQLAKRNSDLVIKREMLKQALEQLKKHGSTRRASKSAESQHPEPSAPPSDAFSAASPACGGLNNEGGGAAGSATLHTNSVTCGAPAVVGSDGVQADSTSRGAAAAVGGYESGADGLRPLSCTEAAQLACQQQGWEVLQLGITRDRASTDESPSLGHDLPTTTSYPDCCASTAEGQSSPPWQPQRLIDQFLDPDAQQRRMYTQLCHGSRVCNAFVEHHKQALADAGLSAPLMLPIPPIPPRASPQAPAWTQLLPPNPYEHELKSCQKHKAQGGVNCEALVCKIAHELNKEQLYTLVSSPFSQRLALWHDSLTKLHCATNNLEINAAEELQQRAAAAEEDEELRGTLRIWALDSGFESPWHSQLVACSNISCANLTRQRSGQLRSAEGVVCPACSTAVFCSHTCLLVAMTGAQAHCMHYMQKRESAGEAEAECRTERGQAKR
ncbi:hypothetical protein DUNSADRAFT_5602 [Dunaliella salina]|uniref:MYND-type domain-containing protein n=1 Tax=Dunaliella salina TaxID=3046 RepID=A0ABQ7GQ12_DUNSA|nr:hypothetical protein DUNSADRAFT_5602 [Dunaliella salina]KAF5836676.1 hypothetical protein DUNSADRAFT_5602 [Dunaliella salina]|eukprot:KAF5836675.1 hypothetical protein DUNSADRAFT_5602 [Dunaliella salina]